MLAALDRRVAAHTVVRKVEADIRNAVEATVVDHAAVDTRSAAEATAAAAEVAAAEVAAAVMLRVKVATLQEAATLHAKVAADMAVVKAAADMHLVRAVEVTDAGREAATLRAVVMLLASQAEVVDMEAAEPEVRIADRKVAEADMLLDRKVETEVVTLRVREAEAVDIVKVHRKNAEDTEAARHANRISIDRNRMSRELIVRDLRVEEAVIKVAEVAEVDTRAVAVITTRAEARVVVAIKAVEEAVIKAAAVEAEAIKVAEVVAAIATTIKAEANKVVAKVAAAEEITTKAAEASKAATSPIGRCAVCRSIRPASADLPTAVAVLQKAVVDKDAHRRVHHRAAEVAQADHLQATNTANVR
jgi:hypothetical protein